MQSSLKVNLIFKFNYRETRTHSWKDTSERLISTHNSRGILTVKNNVRVCLSFSVFILKGQSSDPLGSSQGGVQGMNNSSSPDSREALRSLGYFPDINTHLPSFSLVFGFLKTNRYPVLPALVHTRI